VGFYGSPSQQAWLNYRQAILDGLVAEGHRIVEVEVVSDSVKDAVTEIRDELSCRSRSDYNIA